MEAGEELVRTAAEHLEAALAAEEPAERDYHIRNALQCCDSVTADVADGSAD